MPRWLASVLARIHAHASEERVRFTHKAFQELGVLELGLDQVDACDVLRELAVADWHDRIRARQTDEWMYVFKPEIAGVVLYVKVLVRDECVVVSFHEDRPDEEDDKNEA